jgi:tyrosyl-tRNA synthetase
MQGLHEHLKNRGFLYQCTDEGHVQRLLDEEKVVFYVGFDPTADSLHVGHLIPILAMVHLQRAGHHPIAVVGGGTAMVGDPSGKTEMRMMLQSEQIRSNGESIARQLERFLVLDGRAGSMVNNADWLTDLGYVPFLREIGSHFSVNRMLAAESYRARLETGLTFLEFNYMLLQAYDFLELARQKGCLLQIGGQDQWGNIVAGTDLIRRKLGRQAYGLTLPLLLDSAGNKIGKTAGGAVWLDADKTSVFDFYQYWRNMDDSDVGRLLKLYSFLPIDECERLGTLPPPAINRGKEILAFEATSLVHGFDQAAGAYLAATAHYPSADPDNAIPTTSRITELGKAADHLPELTATIDPATGTVLVCDLLVQAGWCKSRGEAKRLIQQGGVKLDDVTVQDTAATLSPEALAAAPVLKAGKKRMARIRAQGRM